MSRRWLKRMIIAALALGATLGAAVAAPPMVLKLNGGGEMRIPRGDWTEIEFTLPETVDLKQQLLLEFDGRIDFPAVGGYCQFGALIVLVNDKELGEDRLVNLPLEFRQCPRGSLEAGEWHAFFQYAGAKSGPRSLERLKGRNGYGFELAYAPDFKTIESPAFLHRIPGYSRSHKVFDLTGLCRHGKNSIALLSVIPESFIAGMQNRSQLPIVLRDLCIRESATRMVKPRPYWMEELIAQSAKREWIAPRRVWNEKFSWRVDDSGELSVEVGGKTYRITSTFSTVGAQNGFPRRPDSEKAWQPEVGKMPVGGVRLTAKGARYAIRRDFVPGPLGLEIRDTIRNLTKEIQPIFLRHRIRVPNPSAEAYILGLRTWPGVDASAPLYFPENPTGFAGQTDGSGLGIAAYDDVLRVHGAMNQFKDDIALTDPHLALAPGKTVTLIWQLYPVNEGGYCSFINNVRHNWGMNCTKANFYGEYNHIFHPVPAGWKPAPGTHWYEVHHRYKEKPYWGLAQWRNDGLWELRKEALASIRRESPKTEVIASVMAMYFSNAGADDLKYFGDAAMVERNGAFPSEIGARFFVPTLHNDFGRMVETLVDRLLDMGYDGIYFDYMEGNINARFTYNQYDGVSGDVDPRSGKLIATKGAYQLLSQDFLKSISRRIAARGKKLYGNLNHQTTSNMYALRELSPLRYSESSRANQMARGQLGPAPTAVCRDSFSHRLHPMVLRALHEGMLTSNYEIYYPNRADNPYTAMWPIAYREMRRGVVIGEDKIVTAVSGRFGFGDASRFSVRFFDEQGVPAKREFPVVVKDGANYLDVSLKPGEIAVIERRR